MIQLDYICLKIFLFILYLGISPLGMHRNRSFSPRSKHQNEIKDAEKRSWCWKRTSVFLLSQVPSWSKRTLLRGGTRGTASGVQKIFSSPSFALFELRPRHVWEFDGEHRVPGTMGASQENPGDTDEFRRTEKYIQEPWDLELNWPGAATWCTGELQGNVDPVHETETHLGGDLLWGCD